MTTHQELEAVVHESGLWDGERRRSHSFVLSPQPFELSQADREVLDELAAAIHRCLLGVSRLMGIAADSALHRSSDKYTDLYRILSKGAAYNLASVRPSNIPLMSKVDLVVGEEGRYWIAEIDACNPRSLGYSVLGRQLVSQIVPEGRQLPGIVPYLVKFLRQHKVTELVFLYGETQRFYLPEFQILAQALAQSGIELRVLCETEIRVTDEGLSEWSSGRPLPGWFMDFPLMNRNGRLVQWLKDAARDKRAQFITPPKHFLGSKALLAVLSAGNCREEFETLLVSQIAEDDLARVRAAIPSAILLRPDDLLTDIEDEAQRLKLILKKVVASGMKGVWFPDDHDYTQVLDVAVTQSGGFILQEQVAGKQWQWASYTPTGVPECYADWQLRLTAYCSREGVKDIAVTACRDTKVHGGPGAILTGTVIV